MRRDTADYNDGQTRQSVGYEDQETLHRVDALQLLEQAKVEKCICLKIREKNLLNLGPRLLVDLLDQSQFL